MKRILPLVLIIVLASSTFPTDTSTVTADILPRVRCQFSKNIYQYGDPVIFHLDVDIFPNTIPGEISLEELRPDGSVNTFSFGVLGQGSYDFTIGRAAPPPGYRVCTLKSKGGFAMLVDRVRWIGGYSVEAGPAPAPVPTPTPAPPPAPTRTTIVPQPTNVPAEQVAAWPWLPPLLIIIIVAGGLLVLYRNIGSTEQTRTRKRNRNSD